MVESLVICIKSSIFLVRLRSLSSQPLFLAET